MNVAIIGSGYVGLVSAACLAELGHVVQCVDVDASKVTRINSGDAPIHEAGLPELLQKNVGKRLTATTDLAAAVCASDVTLIAVGTPFDGERIDLKYVTTAAEQIGAALKNHPAYHVVAVKSTVVPGTTERVVLQAVERGSGKKAGADFGIGVNPEFLTEGVAVRDFMHPDRIVIGGIDARSVERLEALYEPFKDTPFVRTNCATGEMIKYASNSILATLISFSNEIAALSSAIGGIDAAEVMHGVHLAQYFTQHRNYKPVPTAAITSFLEAGCGFGGSCLPKDVSALVAHGRHHGTSMPLLQAVLDTNKLQPRSFVRRLNRAFPSLAGKRVTVLGLAFKPDTDDLRETPAVPIIRELLVQGAQVVAHDPIAIPAARQSFPQLGLNGPTLAYEADLDRALVATDAVVLVTRWDEYGDLAERLAGRNPQPLVLDGRRMLDKRKFARYDGVGL